MFVKSAFSSHPWHVSFKGLVETSSPGGGACLCWQLPPERKKTRKQTSAVLTSFQVDW